MAGWSGELRRSASATARYAHPVSVGRRLAEMLPVIAQCGAAAVVAWWLAATVLGHRQPVFAATAAVICLAGGKGERARQAVDLLVGVLAGVLVGEAIRHWGPQSVLLQVAIAVVLGMGAATILDPRRLANIQGAASALFVLVLPSVQNPGGRLLDAAIGGGLGLVGSQLLFTPDPVRLVASAARRVLHSTAAALAHSAHALRHCDAAAAAEALGSARDARGDLSTLTQQRSIAHDIQARTARGRYRASRASTLMPQMDALDVLVSSTLLLAHEADRLHTTGEPGRAELADFLDTASDDVATLARAVAARSRGHKAHPEPQAEVPRGVPQPARDLAEMLTAALTGLADPGASPPG